MNLVNKTSTITVAVVGAIVALAIAAHASGALRLSPTRAAGRGTVPSAAASPATGGGATLASGGASQGGTGAGGLASSGGRGTSTSQAESTTGSSGSASGGHRDRYAKIPHPLIPDFPHTLLPTVTSIPSPSGTIGDPGVPCLQGYVWRKAYPGDYVCVTPGTRAQAQADNAAALSRVAPGGGAYGQYTCVPGYVWRQVVPDDYVCGPRP